MALPYKFTGSTFSKSAGIIDAIKKQLRSLTLKPVKRLTFSFNPYQENVASVRIAAEHLYIDSIRETNYNCIYKTIVHNNIEEPKLEVKLTTGETVLFKTKNLSALEILQKYNQLISSLHKEDAV